MKRPSKSPAASNTSSGKPTKNRAERRKELGVRIGSLSVFPDQDRKLRDLEEFLKDAGYRGNVRSLAIRTALRTISIGPELLAIAKRVKVGSNWKKKSAYFHAEDDEILKEMSRFLAREGMSAEAVCARAAIEAAHPPGKKFLSIAEALLKRLDRRGKP